MIFTFLGEIATLSDALGISTGSYCSKVIGAKGKKRLKTYAGCAVMWHQNFPNRSQDEAAGIFALCDSVVDDSSG